MRNLFIVFLLLFGLTKMANSQHSDIQSSENEYGEPHWRLAFLIGHTLIPEEHAGENFFIPSWGLDLEYWVNQKFGVGVHSDLEIETFVIIGEDNEDVLERISPLVLTLDVLYKPWKGLVLQVGPGVELEKEENFSLLRAGVEYEFELNHHWDISPTIFYDTRFDEYHTWSIALGVGKRF